MIQPRKIISTYYVHISLQIRCQRLLNQKILLVQIHQTILTIHNFLYYMEAKEQE